MLSGKNTCALIFALKYNHKTPRPDNSAQLSPCWEHVMSELFTKCHFAISSTVKEAWGVAEREPRRPGRPTGRAALRGEGGRSQRNSKPLTH